jgi:hypothetical protein
MNQGTITKMYKISIRINEISIDYKISIRKSIMIEIYKRERSEINQKDT